jgi:hypothetical protein
MITGRVISATEARNPIADAVVTLTQAADGGQRRAVTSPDGNFTFDDLPNGRYLLAVEKPGFLQTSYGSSVPGRPGRLIVLAAGQSATGLTVTLYRGGVLSGLLRDPRGDAVQGVEIVAMRRRFVEGRQVFRREAVGTTDDRGRYRLFGLYPDQYLLAAVPRRLMPFTDRAESDRKQPSADVVAAPPTYYPGVVEMGLAQPVMVGLGDEHVSLDFQIAAVSAGRLSGELLVPESVDRSSVQVELVPGGWPDSRVAVNRFVPLAENGTFEVTGLWPGQYTLSATTAQADAGRTGDHAIPLRWWGEVALLVEGGQVAPVSLRLRKASSARGRLLVQPAGDRSSLVEPVTVSLVCMSPGRRFLAREDAPTGRNGTFQFFGVLPGRYRIDVAVAPPWILARVDLAGREVTNQQVDIDAGSDIDDLVLTVTDRSSTIAGTVRDVAGPAPEYLLVLFPVERDSWQVGSRRVRSIRPDTAGHFEFSGIQAGDYYLAALSEVDPNETQDPSFLAWLSTQSPMRLTVKSGEHKTQDIRVGLDGLPPGTAGGSK